MLRGPRVCSCVAPVNSRSPPISPHVVKYGGLHSLLYTLRPAGIVSSHSWNLPHWEIMSLSIDALRKERPINPRPCSNAWSPSLVEGWYGPPPWRSQTRRPSASQRRPTDWARRVVVFGDLFFFYIRSIFWPIYDRSQVNFWETRRFSTSRDNSDEAIWQILSWSLVFSWRVWRCVMAFPSCLQVNLQHFNI